MAVTIEKIDCKLPLTPALNFVNRKTNLSGDVRDDNLRTFMSLT